MFIKEVAGDDDYRRSTDFFNVTLSFPYYYLFQSIFMDFEWLLSTLFDASLLSH